MRGHRLETVEVVLGALQERRLLPHRLHEGRRRGQGRRRFLRRRQRLLPHAGRLLHRDPNTKRRH